MPTAFQSSKGTYQVYEEVVSRNTAMAVGNIPTFDAAGLMFDSGVSFASIASVNKQVGTIFSDDFTNVNTFTNNYTITGGTFTTAAISGGTGVYTAYAKWKALRQSSEKCRPVFRYQIGTINTAGLALLITGLNDAANLICHLDTTVSSASVLKVFGGGGTFNMSGNIKSVATTLNVALNDVIEISCGVVNNTITVIATNITQSNTYVQVVYTYNLGNGFVTPVPQVNHGYFAIASVGGSHVPLKFSCIEKSVSAPDYVWFGDSIARGYNTLSYHQTYIHQLKARGVNVTLCAGHSDKITDYTNDETFSWLEKIDPFKKAIVVVSLGSNDIAQVSPTINADYVALIARITASGRQYQVMNVLNRNTFTTAINTFNAFLFTTYGETVWNVNGLLPLNSVYFATDLTHLNITGAKAISDFVFDKMKTSFSDITIESIYQRDYKFKVSERFTPAFTVLTSSIIGTDTTLSLFTSANFQGDGIVYIKNNANAFEFASYTSNAGGTSVSGVRRGILGTAAQSWASGDSVNNVYEMLSTSDSEKPFYMSRAFGVGGSANAGFFWNSAKTFAQEDQYMFTLAQNARFRIFGTTPRVQFTKAQTLDAFTLLWDFDNGSGITTGFNHRYDGSGDFYLNAGGSSNTYIYAAKASRNFVIGSATDVYRTTNAGADVAAQFFIDPARSITAGIGYAFDSANGFSFTQGNSTRRIAGASVRAINLTATAGSEAMDLGIYTQAAGAAPALRATFNASGIATIHLQGSSATPAIAAGAGAGTSPTVVVAGSDMGGYITITTGTLPTLSAIVATITFNVAYTSAPRLINLTPANDNAALLSGASMVFVDQGGVTTTTFAITAGATALIAATVYKFYYSVIQ